MLQKLFFALKRVFSHGVGFRVRALELSGRLQYSGSWDLEALRPKLERPPLEVVKP